MNSVKVIAGYVITGALLGAALTGLIAKSCAEDPKVKVEVHERVIEANLDSIEAVLRAEMKAEIKPVVITRVQSDTVTEYRDAELHQLLVEELYGDIEHLIRQNDSLRDIVATSTTVTDDYELYQEYRMLDRQFAHRLKIFTRDTTRTETMPCPTSWWGTLKDYALVGAITYIILSTLL